MGGSIFCVIFGLLWTVGAVMMGMDMGAKTYRQYQSKDFAQAPGVIRESKVEERRGSKGKRSYSPKIRYEYRVGDKVYESSTIRFGVAVSMKGAVTEEVQRFPFGKEVAVYYDAANPASSTLDTSLRGSDFFGLLFLTPFICIGVGLVAGGVSSILGRFRPDEAGGTRILTSAGGRTQVRLPEIHPLFYALVTLGGLSFVCIFAVGFSTGMNPPMTSVILSWLACVVAGLVVFLREYSRLKLGYYDLIIDSGSAMVSLPRIYGLKTPKAVGFRDIKAVLVKENVTKKSKGGVSRTYDIVLQLADGFQHKIANRSQQPPAAALAAWLRSKLGVSGP